MKTKRLLLAVILVSLTGPALARNEAQLRIHLPRTVQVEVDSLTINSIGVVACKDAELADNAGAVAMGRAPWSKEEIVIDRRTILSRLAATGIDTNLVELTGAKKIKVRRRELLVEAGNILREAETFLENSKSGADYYHWQLVSQPHDMVVSGSKNFELKAQLAKQISGNRLTVEVAAVNNGQKLASTEVVFQKVYLSRQAVTIKEIPAGGVIRSENTKIRAATAASEPKQWASPYGMIARRRLPLGTIIRPGLVMPKETQLVVRRGQTVVMRIEGLGFTVSAIGQALRDGSGGDFIKVRNIDTKRIITAKVRFDGTVEPTFEEVR